MKDRHLLPNGESVLTYEGNTVWVLFRGNWHPGIIVKTGRKYATVLRDDGKTVKKASFDDLRNRQARKNGADKPE